VPRACAVTSSSSLARAAMQVITSRAPLHRQTGAISSRSERRTAAPARNRSGRLAPRGGDCYVTRDGAFVAVHGSRHVIVQHTGRDEDRTSGTVLELTDEEMAMADAYEPAGYRRVTARFASGRQGWVYVADDSTSLSAP